MESGTRKGSFQLLNITSSGMTLPEVVIKDLPLMSSGLKQHLDNESDSMGALVSSEEKSEILYF